MCLFRSEARYPALAPGCRGMPGDARRDPWQIPCLRAKSTGLDHTLTRPFAVLGRASEGEAHERRGHAVPRREARQEELRRHLGGGESPASRSSARDGLGPPASPRAGFSWHPDSFMIHRQCLGVSCPPPISSC